MNERMRNALTNAFEDEHHDLVIAAERIYEKAANIHAAMLTLDRQVAEYKARRAELQKVAGMVDRHVTDLDLHVVGDDGERITQLTAYNSTGVGNHHPAINLA